MATLNALLTRNSQVVWIHHTLLQKEIYYMSFTRRGARRTNDTEQNKALLQMKQGIMLLKKEVERLRTGFERTQRELIMTKEECKKR